MFRLMPPIRIVPTLLALVGLALLPAPTAGAQTAYEIRSIVKLGDTLGDAQIKTRDAFEIGTINDRGQILFSVYLQMLVQYTDGRLNVIVSPGKDAPGGKWASAPFTWVPSMNQLGHAAFSTHIRTDSRTSFGTFRWDYTSQTATAVALRGMPAANGLTFGDVGDSPPVINDRNEIAFDGQVRNLAGLPKPGVFLLGQDGKLLPIALPDQQLPGGEKVLHAVAPSLNDAGVIAFVVRRQSGGRECGYLWESGVITPVAVVGDSAPGGGRFQVVTGLRVNNKNRNVLLCGRVEGSKSDGVYLSAEGKILPVAVGGQEMPGGGKFNTLNTVLPEFGPTVAGAPYEISPANALGQHAFVAVLEGGDTAAYQMDADGKLSLILKSGASTELGRIKRIGRGPANVTVNKGVGLNSSGQVALTVEIEGGGTHLVLLTPRTR